MKRLGLVLLLLGISTLSYSSEVSFRFTFKAVASGRWINDALTVQAHTDFGETVYEFNDDGTGVSIFVDEDKNESRRSFLWEDVQTDTTTNNWGPFLMIDNQFFHLTFSTGSQTYISISGDFKSANRYSAMVGEGGPFYNFAVGELSF